MFKANSKILALFIAIIPVFVACASIAAEEDKERSKLAHQKVVAGATLLDVRTPDEYAVGHAAGAINIPVQVLEKRLSELPKGKEVVVYCHSGRRSAQAAGILTNAGYKVFDLKRFSDW